jgi:hypothetical protein
MSPPTRPWPPQLIGERAQHMALHPVHPGPDQPEIPASHAPGRVVGGPDAELETQTRPIAHRFRTARRDRRRPRQLDRTGLGKGNEFIAVAEVQERRAQPIRPRQSPHAEASRWVVRQELKTGLERRRAKVIDAKPPRPFARGTARQHARAHERAKNRRSSDVRVADHLPDSLGCRGQIDMLPLAPTCHGNRSLEHARRFHGSGTQKAVSRHSRRAKHFACRRRRGPATPSLPPRLSPGCAAHSRRAPSPLPRARRGPHGAAHS